MDPIPLFTYTNSSHVTLSNSQRTMEPGQFRYRHIVLVQGSFRQQLDLYRYPFDEHELKIILTAAPKYGYFPLTADTADISHEPNIRPGGWRVTGFRMTIGKQHYRTNLGDTGLPSGTGTTHARAYLRISVVDINRTIFWQLTGPLIIVFLIALASLLLRHDDKGSLGGRMGLLGAALFAVILNMQKVNSTIPDTSGLTMLDELHLLTLGYVLLMVGLTAWSWRLATQRGHERTTARLSTARLNLIGVLAGLVVYLLAFVAIIIGAVVSS